MYSRTIPMRTPSSGFAPVAAVSDTYDALGVKPPGSAEYGSRGSKYPVAESLMASSTRAVSATVRHWMPARSRYGSAPMAPPYGSNPFVVTNPTTALRQAG